MTLSRTAALSTLTLALMTFSGCFLFNCGDDDDDIVVDDSDSDVTDDRSDDSAPVFLDFSVNTSVATDADEITFTAVLTDPDGIEDLIGGTLKSPGGSSYGAFQTSSSEGAYELSLNWGDLNTVDIIELDVTNQRTFVAEFFDATGNTSSREIALTLECEADYTGTCGGDGLCEPMDTVDACGSCDNDCDADTPSVSGTMEVVVEPLCGVENDGDEEHFCWSRYSVDAGSGDSCNDVCGEWDCFNAFTEAGEVQCNSEVDEQLYCTCERRG